jgi:hypothetical protein
MVPNPNKIRRRGAPTSTSVEFALSHLETATVKAPAARGRRPILAVILIGVSVLATFGWIATMVWWFAILMGKL